MEGTKLWIRSGINDTPALPLVQDLLPPAEPPIGSNQNCRVQMSRFKLHQHHFSLFFSLTLSLPFPPENTNLPAPPRQGVLVRKVRRSGQSSCLVPTVPQLGSSSMWPGDSEEQWAVPALDYGGALTRLER